MTEFSTVGWLWQSYDKVMTKLWQSYDKVMTKLWQSWKIHDKEFVVMTKIINVMTRNICYDKDNYVMTK